MDKINKEYSLGLYEKSMPSQLRWYEKLMVVKECGFDYLEMSIDESNEKIKRLYATKEEVNEIKEAMEKSGVPICSICLSAHRKYPLGSKKIEVQDKALEIIEKAIYLAGCLGVRCIQLAGYDVYYEEGDYITKDYFIKNLKKSVIMAAKKGILLGFETMETPFMDTVEKAMFYVRLIQSPYLKIYPDIGNLKNASLLYGTSLNDDISLGAGNIIAAHLKETIPGIYREVPFGQGHTEYINNLIMMKHMGVRMFVGEFWFTGNPAWRQDIYEANKFLRERLNQVFE